MLERGRDDGARRIDGESYICLYIHREKDIGIPADRHRKRDRDRERIWRREIETEIEEER